MSKQFSEDDLDKIIREIIGAERKIMLETGNSASARTKKIREIIERRSKDTVTHDT